MKEWELVCEWDTQVEKCYTLGPKFVLTVARLCLVGIQESNTCGDRNDYCIAPSNPRN